MATTIYFVKATYDGTTYKLSDFYTGSSYKQIANSSLQVDMAFNDGPTILDTQIRTLASGADLRDQTHIIVPSKKKIYRIDKIDEPNYDAYRLYLSDDPLIGNYQSFRAENMYLTRTNDPSVYTGLNDLPSLGTNPSSLTIKNNLGEGALLGDWMLIFVQGLDATQRASYVKSRVSFNTNQAYLKSYSNISTLRSEFPELGPYTSISLALTSMPYYYGYSRNVADGNPYMATTIYSYGLKKEGSVYYFRWQNNSYSGYPEQIPSSIELTTTVTTSETVNDLTYTFFPDQPCFVIMLPLMNCITREADYINYISGYYFRSIEWYNGSAWQSHNVLSVKILNGLSLIQSVSTMSSGNNTGKLFTYLKSFSSGSWYVPILNTSVRELNISYQSSAISTITLREPFKYYELWIYGQKYDIPSFLVHSLYLRQQLNVNGINYAIYRDPEYKNLYISGSVSMDVQWSSDSLADWVAQNPTYKDQFNLRKQQQWAETLVGAGGAIGKGALSGSMVPVVGTAAGAAMGAAQAVQSIATTAVRTHFDKKNLDLSLQSNSLLTDKLYGDTSSSYQYFNIRPGIFWAVKTMNNDTQMIYQYDTMGYPTNKITTINAMPWTTYNNTLGAYAKLVYGYFNKTIVNAYVTQEINNKLKDGVILVE